MDIYVYERDLSIVDVLDEYKSIIWTTRYFTAGDFELYLPASDKNIMLLKEDRLLVRDKDISDDDYKNVMIIESVQITTSVEEGDFLIVTGRCLKSLLSRRIVWQQTSLTGKIETALYRVVNENAVNPTNSARKIDNLILAEQKGFLDRIDKQSTGDNLMEFVSAVCMAYGFGWDISVKDGQFVFEIYKGEDRSYAQTVNPWVVFSQEFENLLTSDYQFSRLTYKNVALVAGEGEGLLRKTATVGTSTGLDRYEVYIDSRDSSTNDGEVTDEQYAQMLVEEGIEALSSDENSATENIEGQIDPDGNYKLNVDYFLGDIVEVINEYGIEQTPRVVEIIDSEDDTGTSVIPTFSTSTDMEV